MFQILIQPTYKFFFRPYFQRRFINLNTSHAYLVYKTLRDFTIHVLNDQKDQKFRSIDPNCNA